jgi:uncharacterized protein (DUF58 family)
VPERAVILQKPLVLVLAGILLVVALVASSTVLFYMFYALFALALVSYIWTRQLVDNLSVERHLLTKWCVAGDVIHEQFKITNTSRLPALWLEVRDGSNLPDYNAGIVENLGGRRSKSWSARVVCRRRGLYRLGPLEVITGDPFGIFAGAVRVGHAASFVVYPPIVDLPGIELPSGRVQGSSRSSARTLQMTTDAASVRPYAPGDSLKRVHWLHTARRGELQVREFDLEPAGNVWIILDLYRNVHLGEGDDSTEEYAVKLATAFINKAIRENKSVGLIAYGAERHVIPQDKGTTHFWRLLEVLATVAADGSVPLAQVIQDTAVGLSRGMSVVIITPSLDRSWLDQAVGLLNKNLTPAAVLLDPQSFGGEGKAESLAMELLRLGLVARVVERGAYFSTLALTKRDVEEKRRSAERGAVILGRLVRGM